MFKQISLAALAATFITGSAAVAYADSNISGGGAGPPTTSSAGLQNDWAASHGVPAFSTTGPSSRTDAYAYAGERRLGRSHQRGRNNAGMRHRY
jgi:hypothetical protein